MEKKYSSQDELLNNNIFFLSYIKSRKKTVLQKIIKSSRKNAYHVNDSQVPPTVYKNQSEILNAMLSVKKVFIGYSKKEDIAKSHFIKYVSKSTVDHQSLQVERVLTNQSAEFRLSEEAHNLAIPIEV